MSVRKSCLVGLPEVGLPESISHQEVPPQLLCSIRTLSWSTGSQIVHFGLAHIFYIFSSQWVVLWLILRAEDCLLEQNSTRAQTGSVTRQGKAMIGLGSDKIQIKEIDKKQQNQNRFLHQFQKKKNRSLLKTWLSGIKLELLRRQKKAVK